MISTPASTTSSPPSNLALQPVGQGRDSGGAEFTFSPGGPEVQLGAAPSGIALLFHGLRRQFVLACAAGLLCGAAAAAAGWFSYAPKYSSYASFRVASTVATVLSGSKQNDTNYELL